MKKVRSSISKARSYAEIGEYWDKHDLNNVWRKTKKVKFEAVAEPEATYYPVERDLSARIQSVAEKQGVSSDTLVNLWLEQKLTSKKRSRKSDRSVPKRSTRAVLKVRIAIQTCFRATSPVGARQLLDSQEYA